MTVPNDLSLFDPPDIRVEAPSAPGSESSRRGAKKINPHRPNLYRRIILQLGASGVLSREALSARLGVKETTLCGRLFELRPTWIEVVPDACRSSAGVTVDGYQLTQTGRDVLRAAA